MPKRIQSDSSVQREIEAKMFLKIKALLNDDSLVSKEIPIDVEGKCVIHPDFYSEKTKTIGEIHAHIGRLKGSQLGKVAKDILKMKLLEDVRGCAFKKYIAVCNREEYDQLTKSDSFLSLAIKTYGIEVLLIDYLSEEDYSKLQKSMRLQDVMRTFDSSSEQ